MWCPSVKRQLSAFADGELRPADARAVEAHLCQCEECRREHDALRSVLHLAALIPDEEMPATLHARIMVRLSYADTLPGGAVAARAERNPTMGPWIYTMLSGAAASLLFGALQHRPGAPITPASVSIRQLTERLASIAPPARPAQREKTPEPKREDQPEPAATRRPTFAGERQRSRMGSRFRPSGNRGQSNEPIAVITGVPATKPQVSPTEATTTLPPTGTVPTPPDTAPATTSPTIAEKPRETTPVISAGPASPPRTLADDEGLRDLKRMLRESSREIPQPTMLPERNTRPE